jgi:hypothetical protein
LFFKVRHYRAGLGEALTDFVFGLFVESFEAALKVFDFLLSGCGWHGCLIGFGRRENYAQGEKGKIKAPYQRANNVFLSVSYRAKTLWNQAMGACTDRHAGTCLQEFLTRI